MNFKLKYKILVGITTLVILLLMTNPSPTAFKEYIGTATSLEPGWHTPVLSPYYVARMKAVLQRYNFFIFSYYYDGDTYFAIAGHFFLIKDPHWFKS
jgi:hypothetical protein